MNGRKNKPFLIHGHMKSDLQKLKKHCYKEAKNVLLSSFCTNIEICVIHFLGCLKKRSNITQLLYYAKIVRNGRINIFLN